MSLAVAFINTQKFDEPIGEVGDELQLITDVFRVFSEDSDFGQVVADRLIPVVVSELRNFLVSREEAAKMAFGKGRNLFSGFENNIKALIDGLNEDIFSSIPAIVDIVLAVVRGLKLENIKQFISDLWDIAENDLGINGETIRQLFSDIFQAVITELQKDYEQGDRTKQSVALYDLSFSVENLRAFVLEEMQIPTVGKQILLNAVTDLWQRNGIEDALSTIEQVFAATDEVVEPLSQIAQCISAQLQTSPGVGAENGTSSSDSEPVLAWYASWVAGKNVYYSADLAQSENIFVNPQLKYFTYKHIRQEDMEKIAFHTAWIVPVLETIPHFAS
ncbi:MAG TPA: hypothetical protein ENJ32_14480, partial [Crenotrichaceae bacterium]|nr:hypothetical protein [Crenotrichaceae bacterium]